MKVVKYNNDFGLAISFQELDKEFVISFSGNLDLYWTIYSKKKSDNHNFIITKENYEVYKLFDQLYDDIENINIFDDIKEENKNKYRLGNYSNYNELFNKETNTITWYSDETNHEVSNILKIKKEKETFNLEFNTQKHIKEYDKDFNSLNHITIRFRNSGSFYYPFNVLFMRMYGKMKQIDDIIDYGHQIHMEEYLYSKNMVKKLTK